MKKFAHPWANILSLRVPPIRQYIMSPTSNLNAPQFVKQLNNKHGLVPILTSCLHCTRATLGDPRCCNGLLVMALPCWPCLCISAARCNNAQPLICQLNLSADHLQSCWGPANTRFYFLKVLLVFQILSWLPQFPFDCHFLMKFQTVQISSQKRPDHFLSSPLLYRHQLHFQTLSQLFRGAHDCWMLPQGLKGQTLERKWKCHQLTITDHNFWPALQVKV